MGIYSGFQSSVQIIILVKMS